MQPILVYTTCDKREDADTIGKAVLMNRLAACVQIVGPVSSLYWWNGEIAADDEYLITMKSEQGRFQQIADLLRTIHPYDVPEIIASELVAVDAPYLEWLRNELSG